MNVPDNYDIYQSHQRSLDRELSRLPVCAYCDNPIQDECYYEIEGETICEECLNANFRKYVCDLEESG